MYYSLKETYPGFASVSLNSRTRKSCINKMMKFMHDNGDIEDYSKETLGERQEWIENCDYKLVRHKHKVKQKEDLE